MSNGTNNKGNGGGQPKPPRDDTDAFEKGQRRDSTDSWIPVEKSDPGEEFTEEGPGDGREPPFGQNDSND